MAQRTLTASVGTKHSPALVRRCLLLVLVGVASLCGCTFYSGSAELLPVAAAGSGGRGGGGGSGQSDAGAAGNDLGGWVEATGALAGRAVASGNVFFLSAKPDEDLLIAGLSMDGLWGSRDGGQSWDGLGHSGTSDLLTNLETTIVYDPDHPEVFWEAGIYFGGGVYRTDDNGETIKRLGDVTHNEAVSIDFSDRKRRTLVAGGHEQTQVLFRSTDGGDHWESIGDAIPTGTGFSTFPLVLDSKTYLLGCSNQILRTVDGGATWETVSKAGGNGAPVQTPDGSIYWMVEFDGGLMRSDDQGLTWQRTIGPGIIGGVLLALPDGRLVSRADKYIVVSADQGVTWTVVSTAFPFNPNGLVYSTQQKAFFIWRNSTDARIPEDSIMRYDWDWKAP